MSKYVRVHPAVAEEPETKHLRDGNRTWSHLIKDIYGRRVLFGDFESDDGAAFDFYHFRLQVMPDSCHCILTWSQAEELAETIIALVKKHRGK